MASEAARRGFVPAALAGLGATSGDVVMYTLMSSGVARALTVAAWVPRAIAVVGGTLMLYFAWGALATARAGPADAAAGHPVGGYLKGLVMILTSPFNWAWWATAGLTMFSGLGPSMVFGFFGGILAWVAFWSGLTRWSAARAPRLAQVVSFGAAVLLAFFGLTLLAFALVGRGLLA